MEKLLTVDEVAELFNVSADTLRREWQAGRFPQPLRISRRSIRWKLSTLQRFIESLETEESELCQN